jgi:hypothetical protein
MANQRPYVTHVAGDQRQTPEVYKTGLFLPPRSCCTVPFAADKAASSPQSCTATASITHWLSLTFSYSPHVKTIGNDAAEKRFGNGHAERDE